MKINDLPFDENLIGRKISSLFGTGNGRILEIYEIVPKDSIEHCDPNGNKTSGPRFNLISVRHFDDPNDGYSGHFYYMNADQELLGESNNENQ